ncbi:MAG: hypothetical protein Q7S37_04735 [bacterium]|nr:hypothetical protein [bacterium]
MNARQRMICFVQGIVAGLWNNPKFETAILPEATGLKRLENSFSQYPAPAEPNRIITEYGHDVLSIGYMTLGGLLTFNCYPYSYIMCCIRTTVGPDSLEQLFSLGWNLKTDQMDRVGTPNSNILYQGLNGAFLDRLNEQLDVLGRILAGRYPGADIYGYYTDQLKQMLMADESPSAVLFRDLLLECGSIRA